jgi:prepilin-type N-terminal cleavage/methylation domain-containing protein
MSAGPPRRGFTLAEVLIALLLFAVGVLGLAASGTAIAVQAGSARQVSDAAHLAGRVLDSLRGVPCRSVTAGTRSEGPATVRWTAAGGPATVRVRAVLDLTTPRGASRWPLDALLPCER